MVVKTKCPACDEEIYIVSMGGKETAAEITENGDNFFEHNCIPSDVLKKLGK